MSCAMPIQNDIVVYRGENIDLQVFLGMNVDLIDKDALSSQLSDSVR